MKILHNINWHDIIFSGWKAVSIRSIATNQNGMISYYEVIQLDIQNFCKLKQKKEFRDKRKQETHSI